MKVKDAIRFIIDAIEALYSPGEAESIAFIILESAGFPRKKIFVQANEELDEESTNFVKKCAGELKKSIPVQYVLGEAAFFGLSFRVNSDVLIPRQETEELVSLIIRENHKQAPSILDIGTGSGCIAVSLAKNIPEAKVYATDISLPALEIARGNAEINGVLINFLKDDMLHPLLPELPKFDVIVSNPPYIRDSEKSKMHNNVLNFEPSLALFVRDDDPLHYYTAISHIASTHLFNGGFLYVEINENLGFETAQLFSSPEFMQTQIIRDIHDKDRFVKTVKKSIS